MTILRQYCGDSSQYQYNIERRGGRVGETAVNPDGAVLHGVYNVHTRTHTQTYTVVQDQMKTRQCLDILPRTFSIQYKIL